MIVDFFNSTVKKYDRIGPDFPLTHWRLYFKGMMQKFCKSKFLYFGDGAEFRAGAYAVSCSKISIGNRVVIRPGCMLFADPRKEGAGIIIEDDVMLGAGVHIYVTNHEYKNPLIPIIEQGHCLSKQVILRRGSWIGAGTIILPGVVVGENSVVAAGSVIINNVMSFTVVGGNPAKILQIIE